VQEALTNTARHAGATRAWVRLAAAAGAVLLEVGDDGAGFDAASAAAGHGLASIRERVELLGGSVVAGAAPGGGARVSVRLRLDEVRA